MPPRFVYWTILAGGLPTAFRAADREDLLPTFKRIQEKHPDAVMKYFARGKLWDSPEAAREDRRRPAPGGDRRPADRRGPDWRPGGEHRDPRQPFKDAKKARNLQWRKTRFERKQRPDEQPSFDRKPRPPREKPHGDPLRQPARPRPFVRTRFERGQGTEEPPAPSRPPGPDREPRPGDVPSPMPPPRPSEPTVPPPGPPERGRAPKGRFQQRPRGPANRRRRP